MKEIPLTKEQVALVDDDMFEYLMQWKWCAYYDPKARCYYAQRSEGKDPTRSTISMHRSIMGNPVWLKVDHTDHNTLHNLKGNLRCVTHSQNTQNSRIPITNKSGYKGVYFNKFNKRWAAKICVHNHNIHLGYFDTPLEAANRYDLAAKHYFGDCSLTNAMIAAAKEDAADER